MTPGYVSSWRRRKVMIIWLDWMLTDGRYDSIHRALGSSRVATKIIGALNKAFIIGWEPVSIVHYTRPGSSIKRPTPNYLATQRHVNWPVIYPKSSYKIMDPVSAALPKNLRCSSGLHHEAYPRSMMPIVVRDERNDSHRFSDFG